MHLPGGAEWIIILLIVVVLFGGGRIAKVGGELGTALREFRRGVSGTDESADPKAEVKPEEAKK